MKAFLYSKSAHFYNKLALSQWHTLHNFYYPRSILRKIYRVFYIYSQEKHVYKRICKNLSHIDILLPKTCVCCRRVMEMPLVILKRMYRGRNNTHLLICMNGNIARQQASRSIVVDIDDFHDTRCICIELCSAVPKGSQDRARIQDLLLDGNTDVVVVFAGIQSSPCRGSSGCSCSCRRRTCVRTRATARAMTCIARAWWWW